MNDFTRAKSPAEVIYPYMDFTKFLAVASVDGSPVTIVDDADTKVEIYDGDTAVTGMIAASRAIESPKVYQLISGGTIGTKYEIRWTVKRSDGLIHEESRGLKVRAAASRD